MTKVVIWGMGEDYEALLNQVNFEIYKGNLEVIAVVCRKEDRYCTRRDGFAVVAKEDIRHLNFEYIIVASGRFYQEIKAEAVEMGIGEEKIINGSVFRRPLFDFVNYKKLLKNPVTILSDDCWGGYAYHYLGLKFSSPCINILWDKAEFAKFIQNPVFYLGTELEMVRESNLKNNIYVIGRLGEKDDYVQLQFTHNTSFQEAKEQWNRRKKRMNLNNLFIKMGFKAAEENKDSYINAFKQCRYKKILFYSGEEDIEGKIYTDRFLWYNQIAQRCVVDYDYTEYLRLNYIYAVDVLKLLTGDQNYQRENG